MNFVTVKCFTHDPIHLPFMHSRFNNFISFCATMRMCWPCLPPSHPNLKCFRLIFILLSIEYSWIKLNEEYGKSCLTWIKQQVFYTIMWVCSLVKSGHILKMKIQWKNFFFSISNHILIKIMSVFLLKQIDLMKSQKFLQV